MPEKLLLGLLFSVMAFGALCFVFGLWMLFAGDMAAAWLALFGAVALIAGWQDIQAAFARYTFSEAGVTVQYPLEKPRNYSWDEFQQVCVCYYSRAMEMSGYSVICLVKKGEKKDVFGRWKTADPFRYRSVLCLDYSDELLATVKMNCPYQVPDLRDRGNYRL